MKVFTCPLSLIGVYGYVALHRGGIVGSWRYFFSASGSVKAEMGEAGRHPRKADQFSLL
jgi:hypothetical protein